MSVRGQASFFERISAAASALLPLGVVLAKADVSPAFREDLPLVRGLGLFGTVGEGGVSALLISFATLFPVGTLPFRASLVSAFALGACGLALYELTKRLLLTNLSTPKLAPPLAAMAALLATLSPAVQGEALVAGGATVGSLLGALSLLFAAQVHASRLSLDATANDPRPSLALGAILGATFAESAPLGLALLLALGLASLATLPRPKTRSTLALAAALFVTALLLLLPALLRPLASLDGGGAMGRIANAVFPFDPALSEASISRPRALSPGELGPYLLALALLGATLGMVRRRLRGLVAAMALLVLLDAVAPRETGSLLSNDPLAGLHALALFSLAALSALGVQAAATKLLAQKTQMSAVASVLLVTVQVALVSMAIEAALSSPPKATSGATAFTNQALERLPARSALLLRSRAIASRLLAAELTEGSRPDVLRVPSALLSEGRMAKGLLDKEPVLAALLRDLSLRGRPTEASLTLLADARPLLVELDPSWDARLVSHLLAERLWLRFLPQPFGRSDREQAFSAAEPRFRAVTQAATWAGRIDGATSSVLATQLRAQAASAGVMGDKEAAFTLLERLSEMAGEGDPFITELSHRLADERSSVRLDGLLR